MLFFWAGELSWSDYGNDVNLKEPLCIRNVLGNMMFILKAQAFLKPNSLYTYIFLVIVIIVAKEKCSWSKFQLPNVYGVIRWGRTIPY